MKIVHSGGGVAAIEGDALEVLRQSPDSSFDTILTDPPYGLAELKASTISAALACWLAGDREFVPTRSRQDSTEEAFSKALKALVPAAVGDPGDTKTHLSQERVAFRVLVHPDLFPVFGSVDLHHEPQSGKEEVDRDRAVGEVDDLLADDRNSQEGQGFVGHVLRRSEFALHPGSVTREGKRTLVRVGVRSHYDSFAQSEASSSVLTLSGAEVNAVLSLDVSGKTGELLPAEGATQSDLGFLLLSSEAIRASSGTGGLPSVSQPGLLGSVDDTTDRALTIDVFVDLPVGWHTSQTITSGGFMGKGWDRFVPPPAVWDEAKRVLKPGGYLICFAGSRTHDLMTLSIRLAGFEILDSIAWLYAQGKPASKNRLKPSFEPIIVARRPPKGSLKANIETHGTGGINVEAGRLDTGRWPPNVALDEESAEALDEQTGTLTSGQAPEGLKRRQAPRESGVYGGGKGLFNGEGPDGTVYGDSGGGSRFMFVAKAPPKERVTVDGVTHPTVKPLELIRWLARLFVPPGGRVLDMFAGSGTLGVVCIEEDFKCVLVENWEPYIPLIIHRIEEALE